MIYWILAIIVMFILFITLIYNFIDTVITRKEFKKLNKKHIELLDAQLKKLMDIEREGK